MSIRYRMITDPAQFADVADLEARIWGSEPHELVAAHTLRVVLHTGGCLIGAFDDRHDPPTMVGFVLGFASHTPPKRLWSHIAAVHPDYQRQGIGYALKQEQRTWALSVGYTQMAWTYDPMLSQNANFNLNRLGAISRTYHVDFYGEMPNDLSRGLPSDRLEVEWDLTATNADDTATSRIDEPAESIDAPFLLVADNNQPRRIAQRVDSPRCHVEIPADFLILKKDNLQLAAAWQQAVRQTLQQAFADGYEATGFQRADTQHYYILTK
jgi:predicted GNAT superfamily acetyltransferase